MMKYRNKEFEKREFVSIMEDVGKKYNGVNTYSNNMKIVTGNDKRLEKIVWEYSLVKSTSTKKNKEGR